MFIPYTHHRLVVWVQSHLKGKHKQHCLCYHCQRFHPGTIFNCKIAKAVYENCVKYGITTPMWECPNFRPLKNGRGGVK